MEFGNLVKIKRNKRNLTLVELEERASVSASFISRIENNTQKSPSAINVFKLAKALDITLKELEECFGTELKDNNEDEQIKLIKHTDYVLVKQAENLLIKIANNTGAYNECIDELTVITRKLKKENIKIIVSNDECDNMIDIRIYDKLLIEKVKKIVMPRLGNRMTLVQGEVLEVTQEEGAYGFSYKLEDLLDVMEEWQSDEIYDDYLEEIYELRKYLKKINY